MLRDIPSFRFLKLPQFACFQEQGKARKATPVRFALDSHAQVVFNDHQCFLRTN
jgi:hypothetical protein